jgi:uncharacterized protein YqgV (UPF0045/DUF77 family)
MNASAEIGFYPLSGEYGHKIGDFIVELEKCPEAVVTVQPMSSLVNGDYDRMMDHLTKICRSILEDGPAVITIRLSNACPTS